MILSPSLADHPREGGDLMPQARGLLEGIPAVAGMIGLN